ncbi:MAG: hypothetical protein LBT99_01410 [Bifidobacteriaceae bacterium]|jgi:hypothetical protein|nr:hypothetical protein [Bifidobacteriaceae bacterium]
MINLKWKKTNSVNIDSNETNLELLNSVFKRILFKKPSFKKLGIFVSITLFGTVAFICGELMRADAASSTTILPIAKGGTGANISGVARANLQAEYTGNKVTAINSTSTNTQYPGALAVYNYVKPLATGTLSTTYFDLYYEKTYDKTVYIWVTNQLMKTAPTSSIDTPLINLPTDLKEDITKQYYPSSNVKFCPQSSSSTCKDTVLYIGAAGTKLSFSSDNGTSIDNNYKYLVTTPLIYKAL